MKLLRVKRNEELKKDIYTTNLGDPSLLNFAFVESDTIIENGTKYKLQSSKFVTCREIVCTIIQSSINAINYCGYKYIVDHDTLRILFSVDSIRFDAKSSKKRLFTAKRLINIIEDYMDLPHSIMTTVKHTELKSESNTWLLTGSKEWIHSPQMISLFLLIFRLCFYHPIFSDTLFEEDLDLDQIITKINDYIMIFEQKISTETNVLFQSKKDLAYMKTITPYLKRFLKNYKKIFEGASKQYYPLKQGQGFIGFGGIDTLFKKETGNVSLNKRFSYHVLNETEND